ncbi:MAG: radical SAM protein [Candidatus Thermoplasmatota archaeon]|nr:radical SAM protein [Candidatus Thermoplasmatota archaeon]
MPARFTEGLTGSCSGNPPQGCRYCDRGSKMVLYITGICRQDCYYCPLSETRKDKDVIYANERPVEGDEWLRTIISEGRRMKALGTGITGGDPMVVPERTALVIRTLKEEFGRKHHIHLYTSGPFDKGLITTMKEAGLDEIRFHPPLFSWTSFRYLENDLDEGDASLTLPYHDLISEAKKMVPAVGLEVPSIIDEEGPGGPSSEGLLELARYACRLKLDFMNINELEASHTNMDIFAEKGYSLVGDSMAVEGSSELAWSVIGQVKKEFPGTRTVFHFCSSVYKDSVQLRNRLKRMANNLKRPYDIVTEDGTFLRGIVVTGDPDGMIAIIREGYGVPDELMEALEDRVLIAPWVLQEIGPSLEEETYLSEVYPTWDGLEVERTPI